jgi:hypothetical protein
MYRIYLDNCCFNRPYDDQGRLKIQLETKTERFISLVIREPFDYTEGQRNLLADMSVKELSNLAMKGYET